MFSSVQVVFLFDINCFKDFPSSRNRLESYISVLKLTCLRLLTEFGAQTENGSDVRWAAKYYDSTVFKPGKANSSFCDFDRANFDSFVCDLTEKLPKPCETKENLTNTRSPPNRKSRRGHGNSHSHCFILNKAIQEALKDYNWDLPDINSPVQFRKTRHNSINEEKLSGIYNAIIVFNTFPHDVDSIKKFIGDDISDGSSKIMLQNLLENATVHELQVGKSFRLHFVDTAARRLYAPHNLPVYSAIEEYLSNFNGALHCISSAVDCSKIFSEELPVVHSTLQLGPHLQGLESSWFLKNARCSKGVGRVRRPQPGPELVWEDSNGISFLNIKLEILVLQGRGSSVWNQASVTGVARTGAAVLATVGAPCSQIILCREQHKQNADPVLDKLLFLLHQHNFLLLLRLTCGGLALLTPFVGAVASLVVLSSSGLSTPPLAPRLEEDSLVALATQPLLNFARSAVIKALASGGGVTESNTGTDAQACQSSTFKGTTAPLFSRCMMESWYSGQITTLKMQQKPLKSKQQLASVRRSLLTRAQRRYCPTVRGLFPAPDTTVIPTANQSGLLERRHDQTSTVGFPAAQPSGGAAAGAVLARTASSHHLPSAGGGTKAASAGQGGGVKAAAPVTASRALRLVNKSKIVTAQQKVKELEEEESEREVARERRVLQSTLRSQRSRALITNTLNTIPDTKDGAAVVQSLCELRESVNGSGAIVGDASTFGESQSVTDGSDLFGTAQTIINIALMHVRSAADAAASSSDVPASIDTGVRASGVGSDNKQLSAISSASCDPTFATVASNEGAQGRNLATANDFSESFDDAESVKSNEDVGVRNSEMPSVGTEKVVKLRVAGNHNNDPRAFFLRLKCVKKVDLDDGDQIRNVGVVTRSRVLADSLLFKIPPIKSEGLPVSKSESTNKIFQAKKIYSTVTNTCDALKGPHNFIFDLCGHTKSGEGLRDILAGVMFNWRDISALPSHCHLPQYQLHVLLHLEIMWLLGYSSFPAPNDADEPLSPERQRRCEQREAHVEEILRLLRAITLNFAPHTTTAFLTNTVLPNYEDTLSEVLIEVYEELNQPLPTSLAEPMSVDTVLQSPTLHQSSSRPASALSAESTRSGGRRRREQRESPLPQPTLERQLAAACFRRARNLYKGHWITLSSIYHRLSTEQQLLKTAPVLSQGSMMGSGGGCGGAGRGGIKRRNSNMAVVTGVGAGRQVVVPGSRMARLTRASSDVIRGAKAGSKKSKVRRSLFDGDGGNSPPSLRRSHTIATTPTVGTKKRKRGATESAAAGREASVSAGRDSKRLQHTPRDERKRRKGSGWLGIQGDAVQKDGLFTPNKYELASPLLKRNKMALTDKMGHVVLCPATPAHLSGRAVAKRRVGVATANTSIAESPEVKGGSRITPHRLRASLLLKRRSSFYSGGQSRNCQRANTSLMVQRLQGKSKEQQDGAALLVETKPKEPSSEPMDSSFLFSKIFSSAPPAVDDQSGVDGSKSEDLPKRKRVGRRALNFDSVDDRVTVNDTRRHSLAAFNSSPVSRRAPRSNGDERITPVKKVIKILNLDTPTKVPGGQNFTENRSKVISPSQKSSPVLTNFNGDLAMTPQRNTDARRPMYLHSPSSSSMTPSKRVQFSLHLTPGKASSVATKPATPKSILKTPNRILPSGARTPQRGTPSRGYLTPSHRPAILVLKTSRADVPQSPDMFSSAKKDPSLFSPNKTPAKFPVQGDGNSSEKILSEMGSSKFTSTATPASMYNSFRSSDLSKSSKRSMASFMSPEKENMQSKSPFKGIVSKNSPVLKTTSPTPLQLGRRSGRVLSFASNKLLLSPRKSVLPSSSPAVENLCSDASKGKTPLGVNNCSTLGNGLASYDSAVCVDRSCFTTETELELVSPMKKSNNSNALFLVHKNVSSLSLSSCTLSVSENETEEPSHSLILHKQKTADHCIQDLTESPSIVQSFSEFMARLDYMADTGITGDEAPILTSNNAMLIEALGEDVTSLSVKLSNPPIYVLPSKNSEQSVADETCDFLCLGDIDRTEAASTDDTEECLPAPLLDIPAMLEDEDHALKLHKYWLYDDANYSGDSNGDDNNSPSPEIEMPLDIRKNLEEALGGRLQSDPIAQKFPDSVTNAETSWIMESQQNCTDADVLPLEGSSQLTVIDDGENLQKQSPQKDPDLTNLSQLEFERCENSSSHENYEKLSRVAGFPNEFSNDEILNNLNEWNASADLRKAVGCQRVQPDTVTQLDVLEDTNYASPRVEFTEAASASRSSDKPIMPVNLPSCVTADHTEQLKEHVSQGYKIKSDCDTDDNKNCEVDSSLCNFQNDPEQQSDHLASVSSSLRPKSKSFNRVIWQEQSVESALRDCDVLSTGSNGSVDQPPKRTRILRPKTEVSNQTLSSSHDTENDSLSTVIPSRSNRRTLKLAKSHCAQLDEISFSPVRARRGRTRKNSKSLRSTSDVLPAEEMETIPQTRRIPSSRRSSRISTDINVLSTSELGRKSKRSSRVGSVNYCENYESEDEMFTVQKALTLSKRHESDNSEDDLFVPRSCSKPKQSKLGDTNVSPLTSRSRIGFADEQYNKKNSVEDISQLSEVARCSNPLNNSSDAEVENTSSGGKRKKRKKLTCEKKDENFSPPKSTILLRPGNRSDLDGSLFSPSRSLCDRSLGITPLQNQENIGYDSDGNRRRTRARLATSYVDFPSDDSAFDVESSLNDSSAGFINASLATPATAAPVPTLEIRHKRLPLQQAPQPHQVKIDQYLSPVRRSSGDETPLGAPPFVNVKPDTGGKIDWKQVKPIRARQKLVEEAEVQKANKASKMNIRREETALENSVSHKKKKRRVKLKFTKQNGDEYRVIRQNVSGSSLNTTVSDLQTSINDVSFSENTNKSSLSSGKKKKRSDDAFITPLRFTRHMSKDSSITPELFQKLIAYSPNSKKNTHSNVSSIAEEENLHEKRGKSPEKLPSIPSTSHQTPTRNVIFTKKKSAKKTGDGLWRVESAEDSPTLKTFIRMQKTLHSIDKTPSVRLASSHLGSPSVRSMLHLSTSPIVDKNSSSSATSGKDSLITGSRVRLDVVPNDWKGDLGHNGGKIENVSHCRKRELESDSSEGPVSKKRRSRSPVFMPTKPRSSKRLYS